MFLTHVLRWLPATWSGQHALTRLAKAKANVMAPSQALGQGHAHARSESQSGATPASASAPGPALHADAHALAAGQSTLLRLARGTVLHLRGGEVSVEDAPALWADHCWPQPMRLRAGETWIVPRTGWWRIDGRPSRDGVGRFSLRR
ncbi:hypothetical protein SAMN05428960_3601 [Mitsuaria sp. PDC51]|uniref:hypothetical protein n=1 Tax=Mitsuaria sp. PDC51 TaxID=1881035 RepID=UPI0008E0A720|nr:hypothetical protein [Mitsuaria sp. PDC51]SFR93879.1 hypothetical protein SAMN05428960_3601 [Mitsuaria sp. PDC51]